MHFYAMIWITVRNQKTAIRQLQGQHAFLGRVFREHKADAGSVFCRMPVRRVMHLQDNVRPPRGPALRNLRTIDRVSFPERRQAEYRWSSTWRPFVELRWEDRRH